jgi:hypothetical protein
VDVPIGIGNDDIRDYEENKSDGSEYSYFSAEEEDGDVWEEDYPDDLNHNIWPPELLHTPTTSHKRRCKCKAPLKPPLDDFTCISLAGGEDAHGSVADGREVDLQ